MLFQWVLLKIHRASFWTWSYWLRDAREIPLSGKSDFDVQMLICLLVLELGLEPGLQSWWSISATEGIWLKSIGCKSQLCLLKVLIAQLGKKDSEQNSGREEEKAIPGRRPCLSTSGGVGDDGSPLGNWRSIWKSQAWSRSFMEARSLWHILD